ncbi:hypothetical protein [Daejeonella sp.]|uniref:hypothetical protein n=1 Tax=Daejeonella sp. TaxID=2805397 RepID=UPI0039837DD4
MKKLDSIMGCEEISQREQMNINGGESIAYWFGYALGKATRTIQDALECSCT